MSEPQRIAGEPISSRLGVIAIELAILAAFWWFVRPVPMLLWSIAGLIVIGGVVPTRYSTLVTGVGLLALSGLMYFYFGDMRLAGLLGVISLVMIPVGAVKLVKSRRRITEQDRG